MTQAIRRNLKFDPTGVAVYRGIFRTLGIFVFLALVCTSFTLQGRSLRESIVMFFIFSSLLVPLLIIKNLVGFFIQRNLISAGERLEAEVIGLDFTWGLNRAWGYRPHVKFEYKGKTHWVEGINLYRKGRLSKGQKVTVFVNRDNPQSCLVYEDVLFRVEP